jgi:hypothetical protein
MVESGETDPRPDGNGHGDYELAIDIFEGEILVRTPGLGGRTEYDAA